MRSYIYILFLLAAFQLNAQTDYGCDGKRYFESITENIVSETVQYGENVAPDGSTYQLMMDIYTPEDNQQNIVRPLIVFAHSGAFIGGERSEMEDLCIRMAERGYVAATIDYRLLNILNGIPDSLKSMDIAIKASHDMKASLRWFMHSAIEDGNPYMIDPEMIFIGGYSAGAITALITGTVDEGEVTQEFVLNILENNGGLQGTTGNPEYLIYEPEIKGIINLSGAIYDTSWIDINDPIIHSFHGDMDEIVAHDYGYATVFNIQIIPLFGSSNINIRTSNIGTAGIFNLISGGDHTNIYIDQSFENNRASFQDAVDVNFAEIICGPISNIIHTDIKNIEVFPNPAQDKLIIPAENLKEVAIFDIQGRKNVLPFIDGNIDISELLPGIYNGIAVTGNNTLRFRFLKL